MAWLGAVYSVPPTNLPCATVSALPLPAPEHPPMAPSHLQTPRPRSPPPWTCVTRRETPPSPPPCSPSPTTSPTSRSAEVSVLCLMFCAAAAVCCAGTALLRWACCTGGCASAPPLVRTSRPAGASATAAAWASAEGLGFVAQVVHAVPPGLPACLPGSHLCLAKRHLHCCTLFCHAAPALAANSAFGFFPLSRPRPADLTYTALNSAVLALGQPALPGEFNKTDKL